MKSMTSRRMRHWNGKTLTAVGLAFCASGALLLAPSTALAQPAGCLANNSTSLDGFVQCITSADYGATNNTMPLDGSGDYTAPAAGDVGAWETVVGLMLNARTVADCTDIDTTIDMAPSGPLSTYEAGVITGTLNGVQKNYCVLYEDDVSQSWRGWGTLIVDLDPRRDLSIQIPHPIYDSFTIEEGFEIFRGVEAHNFLMAGTHRCASATLTCDGQDHANKVCDDETNGTTVNYRISDPPHNPDTLFHAAVREMAVFYEQQNRDFVALQFHALGDPTCPNLDVYMTYGVAAVPQVFPANPLPGQPFETPLGPPSAQDVLDALPQPGSTLVTLRDHVAAWNDDPGTLGLDWDVTEPTAATMTNGNAEHCARAGTDNVQGRMLNNPGLQLNWCTTAGQDPPSGRFIHIEQHDEFRNADDWIEPIKRNWSIDLVFVIDTTASMSDDIDAAKTAASNIVAEVQRLPSDIRLAIVSYEDFPQAPYGDPATDSTYRLVCGFDDCSDPQTAQANITNNLPIHDGRDDPESVYSALTKTITAMPWRPGAKKAIILIGDAPPHSEGAGDTEPYAENVDCYTGPDASDFSLCAVCNQTQQLGLDDVQCVAAEADPVLIFPIAIDNPDPAVTALTRATFAEIAEATGGALCEAPTAEDMVACLLDTVEKLESPAPPAAPPSCASATATPSTIDASNHEMVPVTIGGVTDPGSGPVSIQIIRITQDEPPQSPGKSGKLPDAVVAGPNTADLRAERDGNGNGRIYAIEFIAQNSRGASCAGTVNVSVPKGQSSAIDDGQVYLSTAPLVLGPDSDPSD